MGTYCLQVQEPECLCTKWRFYAKEAEKLAGLQFTLDPFFFKLCMCHFFESFFCLGPKEAQRELQLATRKCLINEVYHAYY